MGYESIIYIVEKSEMLDLIEKNKFYAQEIAKFDLCKMDYNGHFHKLLGNSKNTDCYIYADDGNTKIITDSCGDSLKEIPIDKLILALKLDDDGYRRIKPLIAYLENLDCTQWRNIIALHYGH